MNCTHERADESYSFCPDCGIPLEQTALDKVLLEAANIKDSRFHPGQVLEDVLSIFYKEGKSIHAKMVITFDHVLEKWEAGYGFEYETGLFRSELLLRAVIKAAFWAATSLSKEQVEKLIEGEAKL